MNNENQDPSSSKKAQTKIFRPVLIISVVVYLEFLVFSFLFFEQINSKLREILTSTLLILIFLMAGVMTINIIVTKFWKSGSSRGILFTGTILYAIVYFFIGWAEISPENPLEQGILWGLGSLAAGPFLLPFWILALIFRNCHFKSVEPL